MNIPVEELREFARNADMLGEALRGRAINHTTSSVSFGVGSLLSVAVALVGFVAIVIAVAAVYVVKAERAADLRAIQSLQHEVEAIREKVDLATVYNNQQDKRLNVLEAKQ